MQAADRARARAAAVAIASAHGLDVDAAHVLNDSNKLTLHLTPCDVVARVAPVSQQSAAFEIDVASHLAARNSPVVALDARGPQRPSERDGFVVTLWTYYRPEPGVPAATDYADALHRLHAGMRDLTVPAPHFTTRIDEAETLVADRDRTPDLSGPDRELLATTLADLRRAIVARGAVEQVLHGEPHPGNVLNTADGLRFIDFETCCRGPVAFDVAHAPDDVSAHYAGLDRDLLRDCQALVLAMVTTWRWDRDDEFPDGRRMGLDGLDRLRALPVSGL